jgi:type II secretory pathway pseudopilin PulG
LQLSRRLGRWSPEIARIFMILLGRRAALQSGPAVGEPVRSPLKAAGFSLVEALVAIAIVAAGVASLAHLIVISAHANRIATTTSVALLLAEQKMEELLGEPASPWRSCWP